MYFLAEVCCIYLNLRWWLLLLLLCGCCCYYCCCNDCFCCWRWCSFHYHIIYDIVIKIMIIQQILIINWLVNFTPLYFYLLSLFRSDWLISLLCFWNHMVLTMWIRPCVNNNCVIIFFINWSLVHGASFAGSASLWCWIRKWTELFKGWLYCREEGVFSSHYPIYLYFFIYKIPQIGQEIGKERIDTFFGNIL